jgi:uncharacterized membrane protein
MNPTLMNATLRKAPAPAGLPRTLLRLLLGGFLAVAGITHLTTARQEFLAQVPAWMPLDADLVVVLSGVVEIALGTALILLPRWRVPVGWVVAAFFVAVFPGNVAQYAEGVDAFGLDTDRARLVRLMFQPVLVAWALWSTGAWRAWRDAREAGQ